MFSTRVYLTPLCIRRKLPYKILTAYGPIFTSFNYTLICTNVTNSHLKKKITKQQKIYKRLKNQTTRSNNLKSNMQHSQVPTMKFPLQLKTKMSHNSQANQFSVFGVFSQHDFNKSFK